MLRRFKLKVKQRFRRRSAASRLHSQAGLGAPSAGQEIGTLASSTGVEIGMVSNQLARVPATGEHEPTETGASDLPTHVGERLSPRIMLSNVHERLTIRSPVQADGFRPPINAAVGIGTLLRPLGDNDHVGQSDRVDDNSVVTASAVTNNCQQGEKDMDRQRVSALRAVQQGFRVKFNIDLEAQLDERRDGAVRVWERYSGMRRMALMASSGVFFF